jgi:hypothetical protein
MPHGAVFEDGLEAGAFFGEHLQTPDRKVECCPPAFAAALARAEAIFGELAGEGASRLKLITRRDPFMHNSWYANLPAMKRGARDRNRLAVHPTICARPRRRRPRDSGTARRDRSGESDDSLLRGVVALAQLGQSAHARRAWLNAGVNANALLPAGRAAEPLSNQAFMTGVPVEIAPIS